MYDICQRSRLCETAYYVAYHVGNYDIFQIYQFQNKGKKEQPLYPEDVTSSSERGGLNSLKRVIVDFDVRPEKITED